MFKIIQKVLLVVVLVLVIALGFQWKTYQEKVTVRDNALLYFEEKDYEKAISYLEEGLENVSIFHKEIDEDMTAYLGESYAQLGKYEEAIQIFQELCEKHPSDKKYYFLIAEIYDAMEAYDQEIPCYKKGWENTKEPIFLTKICDTYLEAGQYEEALQYAEEGIALGQEEAADFMFKKIVIYEKWLDYEAAYEAAREYCDAYPEDEKGQKELKFLTTRIG